MGADPASLAVFDALQLVALLDSHLLLRKVESTFTTDLWFRCQDEQKANSKGLLDETVLFVAAKAA